MQNKTATEKFLVFAIILSMFIWGIGWPSNKVLAGYGSPVNLVVYRYIIVVISLLPILFFLKASFKIKKEGIPLVLFAGFIFAVYSYCFIKGLKHGFAGAGGVLVTTLNPIMAYAIGLSLNRKRPSVNEAIGLTLGLIAGCVLLNIRGNLGSIFSAGNLYFLSAAFLWTIVSKSTSKGTTYGSSLGFSLWMYLVALCCLLP